MGLWNLNPKQYHVQLPFAALFYIEQQNPS